ncbi:thioesterase II family protein [Paenibacillus sp. KR2-11]|uniref:thioesterase II family protein n=1 Tax=Paenibacillus sp. KR2-11 TaxID=3385500 RepID=UPI0038FC73E5
MLNENKEWIVRTPSAKQPALRLFALPYAGGAASIYREWAKMLPQGVELCAIQLPGRESRLFDTPYTSIHPLTDKLCEVIQPLLDVPYALFGHSMGALIAFEAARKLQAAGKPPLHLFVSAQSAPHRRQVPEEPRHLLPDDRFIDKLRTMEYTPEEVLRNHELMQLLLPMLRADFGVCDTYAYTPGEKLRCPVSAYGGLEDKGVGQELVAAWGECTEGLFTMRMVPGGHFFIHPERELLTADIAATLQLAARGLMAGQPG